MLEKNISELSFTDQSQTWLQRLANPNCHHVHLVDSCKVYMLRALLQVSTTSNFSSKLVISYLEAFN